MTVYCIRTYLQKYEYGGTRLERILFFSKWTRTSTYPRINFTNHFLNQHLRASLPSDWLSFWSCDKLSGHLRCSSVVRKLFLSLSTSFFRKRICRIMFSGESISMETSLGDGGADTGWSSFSWRILVWKIGKTKQNTGLLLLFKMFYLLLFVLKKKKRN